MAGYLSGQVPRTHWDTWQATQGRAPPGRGAPVLTGERPQHASARTRRPAGSCVHTAHVSREDTPIPSECCSQCGRARPAFPGVLRPMGTHGHTSDHLGRPRVSVSTDLQTFRSPRSGGLSRVFCHFPHTHTHGPGSCCHSWFPAARAFAGDSAHWDRVQADKEPSGWVPSLSPLSPLE